MKYENIKKAGLTTKDIAKKLGYANVNSFRNSTKYKRIMQLINEVAGIKMEYPSSFSYKELQLESEALNIMVLNTNKKLKEFANKAN